MTEAPGAKIAPEMGAWLGGWENCTQTVLSQITGQPVAFDVSPEPLAGADSDLWFTVVVGGAVRGEMSLRLPVATAVRLAQRFLQETAPPPDEPTADHKEALVELLRQVAGQAATALTSTVGGEVQFNVTASTAPSWSPAGVKSLHTRDEAGTPVSIEIQVSAALATALSTPTPTPLPPVVAAPAPTPAPLPPPPLPMMPSATGARYERLRDVILDVKLRFGSRRMLLRDVLALTTGAVVELDSAVSAPVDLLLDGRLVAQGDVVVVDGKYGLRVTQVIDSRLPS